MACIKSITSGTFHISLDYSAIHSKWYPFKKLSLRIRFVHNADSAFLLTRCRENTHNARPQKKTQKCLSHKQLRRGLASVLRILDEKKGSLLLKKSQGWTKRSQHERE